MFTQPAPSSPGFSHSASSHQPTSSTTTTTTTTTRSRLRGLHYLRAYTSHHIRSNSSSGNSNSNNSASASTLASGSSAAHRVSRSVSESLSSLPAGRRLSRLLPTNDTDASISELLIGDPVASTNSSASSQLPVQRTESSSDPSSEPEQEQVTNPTRTDPETNVPDMTRTRSATTGDVSGESLPSIRFSAHYDARSNRQSLTFSPVSRTLPTGKEVIKVGRYSERENHHPVPTNAPSAAPVGFKSKVVSRRHCEFWYENGKWYIKDVKSSSGTFLNHIRLSPPATESRPYVINDGDIIQLGIDFRGGEEMIFRCVKMRVELNRGWQAKPNTFNMATHKRLRNLTSAGSTASSAQDCSICLNAIAPCQSLFVAPCSHTWHYKCIRELLTGPQYPIFTCPNCRAAADLDADVDEPTEEWQQLDSGAEDTSDGPESSLAAPSDLPSRGMSVSPSARDVTPQPTQEESYAGDATVLLDSPAMDRHADQDHATSNPVPIVGSNGQHGSTRSTRTPSPTPNSFRGVHNHPLAPNGTEGPLTPRNDAGPWVFDGTAGRPSQEAARHNAMNSLDAAATQVETNAA